MKYPEEKLIPVKSESELRPGMTVVLKPCGNCGRVHGALILLRRQLDSDSICDRCFDEGSSWRVQATAQACTPGMTVDEACFCETIPEGRLFRLDTGIDEAEDARVDAITDAVIKIRKTGALAWLR